MNPRLALLVPAAALGLGGGPRLDAAYVPPPYDQAPINYTHAVPDDAVSRLTGRIASGAFRLAGSDKDILRAVLRELGVPESSQVLVFSKTSLEASLIGPGNPRALYFCDSTYVGYVPGGLIEAAAVDPQLGPVFYALDPEDIREGRRSFVREKTCLRCHAAGDAREIPEVFMRSVVASETGEVLSPRDAGVTGDATPFESRWGGWFVTGYTGNADHLGNAFGSDVGGKPVVHPSAERPVRVVPGSVAAKFLVDTSDVVALLVLQHQVEMQDALTRAGQRVRRALFPGGAGGVSGQLSGAQGEVIDRETSELLDRLLFFQAARLPPGIGGGGAFRESFRRAAPRSREGDSLRDFSTDGRLFANRCSYLIYSDSFKGLPVPLRRRVLDRLRAVLEHEDPNGRYGYLGAQERRRILAVLTQTGVFADPAAGG